MSLITKAIMHAFTSKGKKVICEFDNNLVNCGKKNRDFLMQLIRDNAQTEYGKKYHFSEIRNVDDFRKNVPLSNYDTYRPYIDRMTNGGEKNLITSYPIAVYATTSGSVGVPKEIPVSERSLKIYAKYTISRATALADEYYSKKHGRHLPNGKGLNTMTISNGTMPDGTPKGCISGAASSQLKSLFPYYLTSPVQVLFPEGDMNLKYLMLRYALCEKKLSFMISVFMSFLTDLMTYMEANWEMFCDDIEKGVINPTIQMPKEVREALTANLKPQPKRAQELREEFSRGFDIPIIPRIWPELNFVSSIGTGTFASHTETMRRYLGAIPIDFSIYGASEALMGATRHIEDKNFLPLTDSVFYEFIPVDSPEDCNETLLLDELKAGEEYEVILTNLSGFYRYRINDVIKVISVTDGVPCFTFSSRKGQSMNLVGEKTTERQTDWCVKEWASRIRISVSDYACYADTSKIPGHYVIIPEPEIDLNLAHMEGYRNLMEELLCEANPSYAEHLKNNEVAPLEIHIQQPQTHALWRELKLAKGASENQLKPVRNLDNPAKLKFFMAMIEK